MGKIIPSLAFLGKFVLCVVGVNVILKVLPDDMETKAREWISLGTAPGQLFGAK